jgi:hypothetical protein
MPTATTLATITLACVLATVITVVGLSALPGILRGIAFYPTLLSIYHLPIGHVVPSILVLTGIKHLQT